MRKARGGEAALILRADWPVVAAQCTDVAIPYDKARNLAEAQRDWLCGALNEPVHFPKRPCRGHSIAWLAQK